jgi:hypothetical protein
MPFWLTRLLLAVYFVVAWAVSWWLMYSEMPHSVDGVVLISGLFAAMAVFALTTMAALIWHVADELAKGIHGIDTPVVAGNEPEEEPEKENTYECAWTETAPEIGDRK